MDAVKIKCPGHDPRIRRQAAHFVGQFPVEAPEEARGQEAFLFNQIDDFGRRCFLDFDIEFFAVCFGQIDDLFEGWYLCPFKLVIKPTASIQGAQVLCAMLGDCSFAVGRAIDAFVMDDEELAIC